MLSDVQRIPSHLSTPEPTSLVKEIQSIFPDSKAISLTGKLLEINSHNENVIGKVQLANGLTVSIVFGSSERIIIISQPIKDDKNKIGREFSGSTVHAQVDFLNSRVNQNLTFHIPYSWKFNKDDPECNESCKNTYMIYEDNQNHNAIIASFVSNPNKKLLNSDLTIGPVSLIEIE